MKHAIINKRLISFNLIVFVFLFNVSKLNSQTDSLVDSKPELLDVYFSAGPMSFPVFSISQNDFKKIVPNSKLMSGDLMDVDINNYSNFPYYTNFEGGNYPAVSSIGSYAQAGITLKLKNKEFKNVDGPWLKLGLNYFSKSTLLNSGAFKNNATKIDTMYMSGSIPVERDSVNFRGLTYKYSCQNINLEVTLLYKFNDKGIFSLFGGPGAMIGVNYNGKAIIKSTQYRSATDYLVFSPQNRVFYQEAAVKKEEKEEFTFGPNFSFGIFIDAGIDLRLGNTVRFVRNTHLFAEIKPMFRGNFVKGAGLQQCVMYAGSVGLRYEFK